MKSSSGAVTRKFHKPAALIFALVVLFGGCSGYRTYNSIHWAKEAYKEGKRAQDNADRQQYGPSGQPLPQSRPGSRQDGAPVVGQQYFETTAKKCLYFLSQNSEGRRIDDALMLMGKAFYELRRYIQAENSLQKLLDTQRKSKYRDDAQFYLVLIKLQQDQMLEAEVMIERLLDQFPRSRYRPLAQYRLGEKYMELGDYHRAEEVFKGVLANYSKFEFESETVSYLGRMYFEQDSLDQALAIYKQLNDKGKSRLQRRDGLLGMARTLSRMGRHEESLGLYRKALAEAQYSEERAEAWVGIYVEYTFMERENEARQGFEEIIEDYPRTEYSAAAWYELGLLYKDYKDHARMDSIPLDSTKLQVFRLNSNVMKTLEGLSQNLLSLRLAEMAFGNVPREANYSPLVEPARLQMEEVRMLYQIFEQVEASDSTTSRDALARLRFLLAEFHDNSGRREQARIGYERLIFDFPNTIWAPKAAINLAWISRDLGDDLRYRQTLELLLSSFPDTRYADMARTELGLPLPERPEGFYMNELAAYTPPRITRETGMPGAPGVGAASSAPGQETRLQMRRRLWQQSVGAGGGA